MTAKSVSAFQKEILVHVAETGMQPASAKKERSFSLLCMRGYIERRYGAGRHWRLTPLGRDVVNGVTRG